MSARATRVGHVRSGGRWVAIGLALAAAVGCGGAGREPPTRAGASGRQGDAAGLGWLAGSWRSGDRRTVEHWTGVRDGLVGVGLSGDGSTTRSFEVMIIHDDGPQLVFTARPNGGQAVRFPEEVRGARSIGFANPAHDDPKRVAYREADGALVASTEGPGGRQEWRLERTRRAAAPEIQKMAEARGAAVQLSGVSPAGDVGFAIARDERGRPRVTIWRRAPESGLWVVVFDQLLTR